MSEQEPINPDSAAIAHGFFFGMLKQELVFKEMGESADAVDKQLDTTPEKFEPIGQNAGDMVDLNVEQKITVYTQQFNAVTGENILWHNRALSLNGHDQLPVERALEIATEAAEPPKDAVLGEHGYETIGDRVIFSARWRHEQDGLPIESDLIKVMVNGAAGRPFSVYRQWRTPDVGAKPVER